MVVSASQQPVISRNGTPDYSEEGLPVARNLLGDFDAVAEQQAATPAGAPSKDEPPSSVMDLGARV